MERRDAAVSAQETCAPAMYPALLRLEGTLALVAGGGAVALRKVRELIACGARVRAVSPAWDPGFDSLGAAPGVERRSRRFKPSDLEGVLVAFAATDDRAAQEALAREARRRNVLCNVADEPVLCSFFVPATLRRGALTVSVATEGKSPALAVALRDRLATSLGEHLGPCLDRLGAARARARTRLAGDPRARREAIARLLPEHVLDALISGRVDLFEEHLESWNASLAD